MRDVCKERKVSKLCFKNVVVLNLCRFVGELSAL